MTTPRLGAPELTEGEAVPEAVVNEQILYMESGAGHFIFKDRDLAIPPGSPANGDCYLVAASGTGDWSGQDGKIAYCINTAWAFITAREGFTAWVNDEDLFIGYDGAAWGILALGTGSAYTPGGTDVALADGGTGASLADPGADRVLFWDDSAGAMTWLTVGTGLTITGTTLEAVSAGNPTESIIIACSDETTAITTGTAKVTFRMPYAFTLTAVRASVTTAPTGSTITIDINEAGSTILSTKLTIDASEKTSTTAAAAAVISDSSLADDAEITIDFDQVGSTVAGAGVKVYLIGTRT
jgi:hypothetical protein